MSFASSRVYILRPPEWLVETSARAFETTTDPQVYLNANVVQLRVDPSGGSINALEFATLGGRRFSASAGAYVLACGGIENARVLLASDRDVPGGVGNGRDLVGRYFMDHPYFWLGHLEPVDARCDHAP